MEKKETSRRNFLQKTVIGAGAGVTGVFAAEAYHRQDTENEKLPREVWIASFSCEGTNAETSDELVDKILAKLDETISYQPDIICLPEIFPFFNAAEKKPISEVAEKGLGKITSRFAEFAKKYHTYIICPLYTTDNGKYYNSSVLIDRNGKYVGEYRKTYTTEGEMKKGVSAGPIDPPVFKTDFGIIGMQICFDVEYPPGWKKLKEKGAEIVFFSSAFPAGVALNSKAQQHQYAVVSSTRGGTSKICDIDGDEIAKTGSYNRSWVIAPINLEKAFLHSWPYNSRFKEIRAKYGRKVKITNYHEEEWTIIESLSEDVKVADILKEFDLKTYAEHMKSAELLQDKMRANS